MLVPGLTGESEMLVRDEDLVSHLGNIDIKVLSTPRLIQLLEAAAVKAIEGLLPPGYVSLGTQVRMKHLAATPLGMKVRAYALLKSVEKNRLLFLVDAQDEVEKVADGEHERVLVPRERFFEKVEKKAGRRERSAVIQKHGNRKTKFEVIDHTADIGVVVYGEDLKSLFENAGEAFFRLITDVGKVRARVQKQVEIPGESLERLMVDWLSELLYLHDVENLLFRRFKVESIGDSGLKATAKGETFREGVHVIKTKVKAVTYHQIQVKQAGDGWKAQIIFDL